MPWREVYLVRDKNGDYVSDADGLVRTLTIGEAHVFTDRRAAQAACRRVTDRVRAMVIDPGPEAVKRGDWGVT